MYCRNLQCSVSIQSLVAEGFQRGKFEPSPTSNAVSIQSLVAEGFQPGASGLPHCQSLFQSSPS